MISFNIPPYVETAHRYIEKSIENHKICGDGEFTKKCSKWMEDKFSALKVLLTTSGTSALEMAAVLCGIQQGDEVIMPSFTFCSTANAFVQRGAKIVFIDIRPDTMNIDEKLIEAAITSKTKAIVPVHYAGVSCNMDTIMKIAKQYNLFVVEDSAQGVMSTYNNKALGTIGTFGCYSFHETKNYSMGEGGAIVINDKNYIEKAEIIREKGTNRSQFLRGQIDKYTWIEYGSSFLPSELNAAYLWSQFEIADEINNWRLGNWTQYYKGLLPLQQQGFIDLPTVPSNCIHNAHMFYIKVKDIEERTQLIQYLKTKDVGAVFHYVPLHSAPAGIKYGRFEGSDTYTTKESERLLRLPMYYGLKNSDVDYVVEQVYKFFKKYL
ncbi:dTDP-4-amino-4,6-dideoxygalactose transaminase [Treponema phagedenis]|uniref:dTDP-4-amino-4,6-dideoxygalactose transaminase n=1 Tax=Treponema phagedenis TaxID=162 RepID=UPI001581A741|nr:dTDP-4-amino-4,6-dideoxygalactose transaminase [Treponema phagedenis]QKS92640.1 dTDP-4-amino-4,6-dideoxygalactose transaminase [Treponema phagedenis]